MKKKKSLKSLSKPKKNTDKCKESINVNAKTNFRKRARAPQKQKQNRVKSVIFCSFSRFSRFQFLFHGLLLSRPPKTFCAHLDFRLSKLVACVIFGWARASKSFATLFEISLVCGFVDSGLMSLILSIFFVYKKVKQFYFLRHNCLLFSLLKKNIFLF